MKRLILAIVTACVLSSGVLIPSATASGPGPCPQGTSGPPPPSQLGQPLTEVVSQNCQSGTEVIGSKVQVVNASGQSSQPTDLAWAQSASCATGCTSIAAAFQVVLVDMNNQTQSPQNAAVAQNQSCTGCGAFAFADQYAVDVAPGTKLTDTARHEIDSIRHQVSVDVNANLPFDQLDAKLQDLAGQLHQDVLNGLKTHGPHNDNQNSQHHGHDS